MAYLMDRYWRTLIPTIILNLIVLAISIAIFCIDLGTYAEAIYNET
jgi:hypothetical protein